VNFFDPPYIQNMATPLVVRNENNVAISYEEFWHLVYNYTIPACDERTDGRTDRPQNIDSIVRIIHIYSAVK